MYPFITLKSDATAAIGMVGRSGLGKVRHLAVSDLWVQQFAKQGVVQYYKVDGVKNGSDMLTKAVDANTLWKHSGFMGQVVLSGRAKSAPQRRK